MSLRAPLVAPVQRLDPAQLARYSRHLTLPGVGEEGQRRIANARVLMIGAGGLGSPVANYLIAAGVGTLAVLDDDTVELSNLQRQIIHRQADVGAPKVDSLPRVAAQLNDQVTVVSLAQRLTEENALSLFSDYDLVIDGSDNFATRYLCNDAAELTGTPLVWGTLFQFSGQASVFDPRNGPMLRDLFPEIPDADSVPSCAEGGVFGALCGVVGSLLAVEALKLITGVGQSLSGKLWLYDALSATVRTLSFESDPHREPVRALGVYTQESCVLEPQIAQLSAQELESLRGTANRPVVVDVRESWERAIGAIPDSIHVPLDELLARGWDALEVPETSCVVFACKSGARSLRAATALSDTSATTQVMNLRGGTLAWYSQVRGETLDY
ncbi:molybdopterin-synthase adenylyltransferase MoeB [Glutamicibacter sp. NPDC087344]|uniref:molybdopterin-synthase adenylyltransferase MoeB n=1 Tax=Glutamicibacter sp. NPDC087344 TaxID=3363994 RepID=UPI0037F5E75B